MYVLVGIERKDIAVFALSGQDRSSRNTCRQSKKQTVFIKYGGYQYAWLPK